MECDKLREEHIDKDLPPCCESCHEDANSGYGEDLWFEVLGEDRHICCALAKAFDI